MLDIAPTELMLVAFVALMVIGPKDLPKAMRLVGKWVGRARGVARQFRSGFDTMMRESELAEMEKQWAAENERIMREHPPAPALPSPQAHLAADIDGAAPAGDLVPAEALESEDAGPVMTEQPALHADPEPAAPAQDAPAKAPRARARKPRKAAPK